MFLKTLSMLPKKLRRSRRKEKKIFLHKEERRNHKMIHLPVPEKFPSRLEEAPREEMSFYASSEELSVHIESLDKKRSIDQIPVPEKSLSRPERNPKKNEEDPRKDPSTQMCARNRQKSILPDTRCPEFPRRMKKIQEKRSPENLQTDVQMSRSLSRTHVDRVTITKLFRRRLSADKCRGTPTWIGLSSHYSEATLSETWASSTRMWMWTRSWVPSRNSDHPSPGPQCRLFLS